MPSDPKETATRLGAGSAATLGALVAGFAVPGLAQTTATTTATGDAVVLDDIVLQGGKIANSNTTSTGISRLPGTVREIPKVVTVVPAEVIREQGVTTLEETLRNVPGITLSTGEGNGGQNGDQFRIRGLTSKGDVYSDGLRDFGVYTRDTFNTESVEVIKGPSGESFGVGNLGGLVNQSSKRASLTDAASASATIGTGPSQRATLDLNRKVGETSALRFSAMYHKQDVADRDHVEFDRRGLAIDFGTGIGTDLEWHIGYSWLHGDKTPDYGVSMVEGDDGILRPLLEYDIPGVDRSISYIRSTDRDVTNTHVVTSSLTKQFDSFTLRNDTRISVFDREFSSTNPAGLTGATADAVLAGTDAAMAYGAGGGSSYKQDGKAFQNVLSVQSDFRAGGLRHKAQVGLDLIWQEDERNYGSFTPARATQTVLNPIYDMGASVLSFSGATRDARATEVGLFASDRAWVNDQFSVQGSLRWSWFKSTYDSSTSTVDGSAETDVLSPAIAAIWEPNANTTIYASFARTYRPIGTDIASAVGGVASETPQEGVDSEPERSDVFEIGGKVDLLDGRLGLTGAIFQVDKDRSYTTDPVTGDITGGFSDAGQGRRVKGVELGASGEIADGWSVYAAYAWLDGEITAGGPANTSTDIGNDAPGVSRHNLSLWTSYDIPPSAIALPGKLTVAGGIKYASKYWADTANTAEIPEAFSLDAVIAYETDKYRLALNGYNLTDHVNYSSSFNAVRAVPTSGRTFAVTVSTRF